LGMSSLRGSRRPLRNLSSKSSPGRRSRAASWSSVRATGRAGTPVRTVGSWSKTGSNATTVTLDGRATSQASAQATGRRRSRTSCE
jgi:hypothetical protein